MDGIRSKTDLQATSLQSGSKPRRRIRFMIAGLFALFFASGSAGGAEGDGKLFQFKLNQDEVLIVDKYQDIRINYGRRIQSREEKNRIVLKVIGREKSAAILEGQFTTYSRSPRKVGEYKLERRWFSRFKIHDDGRYEVPAIYVMPNLRDLPRFPDRALKPGERWRNPAMELLNLGRFRFKIPVRVKYKYTGTAAVIPVSKISPDKKFERIEYNYSFNRPSRSPLVRRISGFSADQLWFDREQGIPVFDSNRLAYTFLFSNGKTVDYDFKILSWYRKIKHVRAPEKKKIVDSVKKQLEKNKNVTVRKNKDGIVLTLNDILFDTASARLTNRARESLGKVAEILKKYPNREIRISGHTDARGGRLYNQRLSQRRARAVLKDLRDNKGISGKRMSYKGYGETRPVGSNATAEGRARNRRVEILIVTE